MRKTILLCSLLCACGRSSLVTGDSESEAIQATADASPDPGACDGGDAGGPLVAAPEDIAGIVAAVLPPFEGNATCGTITARLYLNDDLAPCEAPDAVDLVSFDVDLDDLDAPPALHFVAPLPPQSAWIETEDPNIYALRWHLQTSHKAGLTPLVGAVVRSNLCPIARPACENERAVRYRTSGEWTALDRGLYFGLEDCHQTLP